MPEPDSRSAVGQRNRPPKNPGLQDCLIGQQNPGGILDQRMKKTEGPWTHRARVFCVWDCGTERMKRERENNQRSDHPTRDQIRG